MQSGNILFCGVGGQGILLASELTAFALLSAGYEVKKSEVHGMAQRGGSVEAHLRYGEKVHSPLIEPGTVDIQVAFETMEAARYLPYLNTKTKTIVNKQHINPPSVATGKMVYPDGLLDNLTDKGIEVFSIDGYALAKEAGNIKAANTVLVGALSKLLPISEDVFKATIEKRIPERFLEANRAAFQKGREAMSI